MRDGNETKREKEMGSHALQKVLETFGDGENRFPSWGTN
jgi:hypothetical protein